MTRLGWTLKGFVLGAIGGGFVADMKFGSGLGSIAWPPFIVMGAFVGSLIGLAVGLAKVEQREAAARREKTRVRDEWE
jgi:uncharacterized protein YcfJ